MYWGSLILSFVNIRGVAAAVPQYISSNTHHIEGGSHKNVRGNMAEKW
jgi:hypothetical protein